MNSKREYQLVLEQFDDTDSSTKKQLIELLHSEAGFPIEEIESLLSKLPQTIKSASSELKLLSLQRLIRSAGGEVSILRPDASSLFSSSVKLGDKLLKPRKKPEKKNITAPRDTINTDLLEVQPTVHETREENYKARPDVEDIAAPKKDHRLEDTGELPPSQKSKKKFQSSIERFRRSTSLRRRVNKEKRDSRTSVRLIKLAKELWRGDRSLPLTFWVFGFVVPFCLFVGFTFVISFTSAISRPLGSEIGSLSHLVMNGYTIFILVAIWRSAARYKGPPLWSLIACGLVILRGLALFVKFFAC